MSDDLKKVRGQDRKRIDVSQQYELKAWSEKFGVTPERLREAVRAVGDQAEAVYQYLAGGNRRSGGERRGGSNGQGQG